jgi:hypothetical protein
MLPYSGPDCLLGLEFLHHLVDNLIQVLLLQTQCLIRHLPAVELISKATFERAPVQDVHHAPAIPLGEHVASVLDVLVDGDVGEGPVGHHCAGGALHGGQHVVLADGEGGDVDELVFVIRERWQWSRRRRRSRSRGVHG